MHVACIEPANPAYHLILSTICQENRGGRSEFLNDSLRLLGRITLRIALQLKGSRLNRKHNMPVSTGAPPSAAQCHTSPRSAFLRQRHAERSGPERLQALRATTAVPIPVVCCSSNEGSSSALSIMRPCGGGGSFQHGYMCIDMMSTGEARHTPLATAVQGGRRGLNWNETHGFYPTTNRRGRISTRHGAL